MNIYLFGFLRLVHIFSGALWIGAAIAYMFFVKPSVEAIGPAAPQFMKSLMERRKYPLFMVSASLLTVLAGVVLYLYDSGGIKLAWILTGPGLGYTIGALAALVAFLVGNFVIGPTAGKMGALGQEIAQSGGPPSPEQVKSMHAMEKKLALAEKVDFWGLTISMLAMVTARFWMF